MTQRQIRLWGYVAAFAVFAALAGTTLFAASAPGSADDPLVSKSYVDNLVAASLSRSNTGAAGTAYGVIFLEPHQALYGGEGCELIMRSGVITAIAPGADGLADVTAGHELTDGVWLSKNHLVLIPRQDGRGIRAGADGAWVMIRGGYTLE